jgi:hypothetical protein
LGLATVFYYLRFDVEQLKLSSVIPVVVTGMPLLTFVAAETSASKSLPGKVTSASAAIPVFRQCLSIRCLANGHIPSQNIKEHFFNSKGYNSAE